MANNVTEALYAVESWYSWHSRDDYTNNIYSIRNAYYGSLDGKVSDKSISKLVAGANAELDTKVSAAITTAASAIQAIPQPFRNNINSQETVAAIKACEELESVLDKELKPYIRDNSTINSNEALDPIVENYVNVVVLPTYKDLKEKNSTYKDFFDGKKSGESDMTKRIHYHNLNVKGIFRLGKYNKLSAGTEFIKELLSSETDNIAGKSMYTTALYAQDEININEHFQAYAGLRYIYHENFKSYATPNVALLYKVGGFNFRGSYAAGFRTPELKELYTESEKKASGATRLTIGNPDLDPEKSDNFTLSAEYTMRYFSLSVSAFMNNVRSMINYKMLDTAERDAYNTAHGTDYDEIQMRANIDKAKIKGINVTFNSYLGAGFTLNGGYSFMDGKNVYEDEPLDKTVKHSGTVAAMWSHTWNKYKLNVNFNGRIQGERYSTSYGYAPKYSLWNLNTSHTFRAGDFLLEPGVGIENLFDYVDDRPFNYNYATLTPGRTYYVSLLVRFKQ